METKLDGQLRIIQYLIDDNNKSSAKTHKTLWSDINNPKKIMAQIMVKMEKLSSEKVEPSKSQDTENVVPANKKYQTLEGGHSTRKYGMWDIKHEIISPKFYELITKIELKRDTALYLNNFYN